MENRMELPSKIYNGYIYNILIYADNGISQKKEWNIAICKQHGWT